MKKLLVIPTVCSPDASRPLHIPRTCAAASCYSLAACRSIARSLPRLLRRDMKASSCASCRRIFVVAPNLISADKTRRKSLQTVDRSVLRCHQLCEIAAQARISIISGRIVNG